MRQMILSCGHEPSPHREHTTGTAHTADGRELCWTCADAEQRAALLTETACTAYLVQDASTGRPVLTTWSGAKLADVTEHWRRRVGFSRDGRLYFRAVDVHGQHWYGTSPGLGMYARMRRTRRAT